MDIKVTPLQQIQQTAQKPAVSESDGSFRFALLSSLEENELQSHLSLMMEDIIQQGNKLSRRMDVKDLQEYRKLIRKFINEIAAHTHEFSRENFLDRKGRHRVYGIVKRINETLDELAEELLAEQRDNISILNKIDEIRGLILDIFT